MKFVAAFALIISSFGFTSFSVQDPDQFERTYTQVRMYCSTNVVELALRAGEWSEMKTATNRFVFNYGTNNEVMVYNASGTTDTYQQASEIIKGTNEDGLPYQEMDLTNADGDEVTLLLFDTSLSMVFYYEDGNYLILQYYK